jgi:exosortase
MFRPRSLAIVAIVAVFVLASWPVYRELHEQWRDSYGTLSHGYLVLALALWFGVRAWRASPALPSPRPEWRFMPLLCVLVACGVLGELMFVGGIRMALLPPIFLCAVAAGMGMPSAWRLAGPAAFLYFALPVWNPLNGLLLSMTTRVAQALVKLCGVPAFVEGNFVHLASGTFQIASGCAGMNYFVVSLTLAAYACLLHVRRRPHRWLLMIAAGAAGLAANWLRVSSLIVIGHVTDMQHYLIRVDHLLYGWVLFVVAMIPVFWLARRFAIAEEGATPASTTDSDVPGLVDHSGIWAGVAVASAILLVPSLWLASKTSPASGVVQAATSTTTACPSGWQPRFDGAVSSCMVTEGGIEIFKAYYRQPMRNARASFPNNSFTGAGWQELESGVPARNMIEHRGYLNGREQLVWGWYEVGGTFAASKISYRMAELSGLFHGRTETVVTAIHSDCRGNCDRTRGRLRASLETLHSAGSVRSPSQNAQP